MNINYQIVTGYKVVINNINKTKVITLYNTLNIT